MPIFIGDDWASDHHDIEIVNGAGHRLARQRVPEGTAGIAELSELLHRHIPDLDHRPQEVIVGIERDKGPWVQTLLAAGFTVYAINPMSARRYSERHTTSGAKSDKADAHTLAEIVRVDRAHHRPIAGDTPLVLALRPLTRAQQKLTADRTRVINRLKDTLRLYFPNALTAYADLGVDNTDTLELLIAAPTSPQARRLTNKAITKILARGHRRIIPTWIDRIRAGLAIEILDQPDDLVEAYSEVAVAYARQIIALNASIADLDRAISAVFRQHPDADIYLSIPGVAQITAPRLLAEFGDDPDRFPNTRSRVNYSGCVPVTKQSGKVTKIHMRRARNTYLANACQQMATHAIHSSPGARRYFEEMTDRGVPYQTALRNIAGHLVRVLGRCLATHTPYHEETAWRRYNQTPPNTSSPTAA